MLPKVIYLEAGFYENGTCCWAYCVGLNGIDEEIVLFGITLVA